MVTFRNRAVVVPLWILAVVAILFFLREARTLLIPIALAVLISYALAPVVTWLERRRVPRLAGAGLVLLLILSAFVGGGYALRHDAKELVEAVPQALERGREMMRCDSDRPARCFGTPAARDLAVSSQKSEVREPRWEVR
jgi:predicted PurR-regulated permease PerM